METSETKLARLEEKVKTLIDKVDQNQDTYNRSSSWMTAVDNTLSSINFRLSSVEQNVSRSTVAIEEFNSIKNKLMGASIAGKWFWTILGVTFGFLYAFHESIAKILATMWR